MKIEEIFVKEIKDSRGEPTIEVELMDKGGRKFTAQIPSGRSVGAREAVAFLFPAAKEALERILKKELVGKDFHSIKELDSFLLQLDPSPQKERLGGNLTLGLSIAFARGLAQEKNFELWQILREEFFPAEEGKILPKIFSNLINGGAHAQNNLDLQEYLVVVQPKDSIGASIQKLEDFYKKLGEWFKNESGLEHLPLGDEGGYALNFKDNFEPIQILAERIKAGHLEAEFNLGLDAAASHFYEEGRYKFENQLLTSSELTQVYLNYFKRMNWLYFLEDPFDEDDGQSFGNLLAQAPGKLIIGDDLTTTRPEMIQSCILHKFINGVIIKANQIGTLKETCAAIEMAKKMDMAAVISHRSGETRDNFLIHIARAANAFGVKIGAPYGIRMSKFDELVRLYE